MMKVINPEMLIVMGIMFEVIGALFLSVESFGAKRVIKYLNSYKKFVLWSKGNFGRFLLISIAPLLPIMYLTYRNESKLLAFTIPMLVAALLVAVMLDNSSQISNFFEKGLRKKRTLSPVGFVLLLVGNLVQVVSVVLQ